MNSRKTAIPDADRTPHARLAEGRAHALVGYQLAQATLVTDEVFQQRVGHTAMDLHRVEYTILAIVDANPGVTARQLARALAVTPPNIAIWLDRLDKRGLTQRERSTRDGRVQHVQLTSPGMTLVARASAALLEGEAAALAGLSSAERAMLVELLHKVALARRTG